MGTTRSLKLPDVFFLSALRSRSAKASCTAREIFPEAQVNIWAFWQLLQPSPGLFFLSDTNHLCLFFHSAYQYISFCARADQAAAGVSLLHPPWENPTLGKQSWELALAAVWLLILKAGCYWVMREKHNFPVSCCIRKDLAFLANEDSETNQSMGLMKLDFHTLTLHPPSSLSAYFSTLTSTVTFLFLWYSNFLSRSPSPPASSPSPLPHLPAMWWERCGVCYLRSAHRPLSKCQCRSSVHQFG